MAVEAPVDTRGKVAPRQRRGEAGAGWAGSTDVQPTQDGAPETPRRIRRRDLPHPSRAAERLSRAMKQFAPGNWFSRWLGPHFVTNHEVFSYNVSDSESRVVQLGYQARRFLPAIKDRRPTLLAVETAGYGLKEKGKRKVHKGPKEIDAFLRASTNGQGDAQSLEAMLLYGIIAYGETNRFWIPKRNTRHIEEILRGAHIGSARTAIEGKEDGKVRLYFPHVEKFGQAQGAKMVEVTTNEPTSILADPEAQAAAFERAHILVANPLVKDVLTRLKEKTVSIEQIGDESIVIHTLDSGSVYLNLSASK